LNKTLCLLVLAFVTVGTAKAASIEALPLPDGFTIPPEAEYRSMVLAPDGTVFAIAAATEKMHRRLVLRWSSSRNAQRFTPLSLVPGHLWPGEKPYPTAIVALNGRGYVTIGQTFDGAYLHSFSGIEQWNALSSTHWSVPECAEYKGSGVHLLAADDNDRMALTSDSSAQAPGPDLSDPASVESRLPIAIVVERGKCTELGHAILTAIDGPNVAGYRGYLDGRLAPWFINAMVQHRVAVRWNGKREMELDSGVPFSINRKGLTVGATALPGHAGQFVYGNFFGPPGRYEYAVPHAVAWQPNGKSVDLTLGDARSVAWDVSEDGTIVGMEQMPDGKHYAFRWRNGRLELLDDLPHPAGWRLESAYAIGRDGSIAGVGRHNGLPTAFVWHE
jgi:probable HAF family extracellular repeat protein